MAALISAAPVCDYSPYPYTVTQNGEDFTFVGTQYACDNGDHGTTGGGGTVLENTFVARWQMISDYFGTVTTDHYAGIMTSTTSATLSESQLSITGALVGTCAISPSLRISIIITSPLAAARVPPLESLHQGLLRRLKQPR
jgi:hypothetical protein